MDTTELQPRKTTTNNGSPAARPGRKRFDPTQLHQKPEIAKIDILATRENEVLATVSGQIIRTGIFQEKVFTEAFNFKLSLRLLRNPNMAANGRFPTAVGDFKYEISN